jgi:hypothetical protein
MLWRITQITCNPHFVLTIQLKPKLLTASQPTPRPPRHSTGPTSSFSQASPLSVPQVAWVCLQILPHLQNKLQGVEGEDGRGEAVSQ